MNKKGFYILGVISGLIMYKLIYFLYTLLLLVDFTSLIPYLININYYCEKFTSKNIAEVGIIILLIIPIILILLNERKRK